MSVTGNILSFKVETKRIQDRNRRGVFAYFLTREQKVRPGADKAQKKYLDNIEEINTISA